jgi:hypothetical protein
MPRNLPTPQDAWLCLAPLFSGSKHFQGHKYLNVLSQVNEIDPFLPFPPELCLADCTVVDIYAA